MKQLLAAATILGTAITSTNPGMNDYEVFVQREIIDWTKTNPAIDILHHTPAGVLLQKFVIHHTQRYDFVIFSVYRSEVNTYFLDRNLSMTSIGLFNNFLVIDAPKL